MRPDALSIEDTTIDGDDDWNWAECETKTTTGYNYGSTDAGRHHMVFCHLVPGAEGATEAKAVQAMMHELGHAIGLAHEHQRPDARATLSYKCSSLEGYQSGVTKATLDADAMFDFDEADDEPDDEPDDEQLKLRIQLM